MAIGGAKWFIKVNNEKGWFDWCKVISEGGRGFWMVKWRKNSNS